jgi:hypothetical protein
MPKTSTTKKNQQFGIFFVSYRKVFRRVTIRYFPFVNQFETRSTGPNAHDHAVIGCADEGRRNKAERNIQGRTTHRQAAPDDGAGAIAPWAGRAELKTKIKNNGKQDLLG